MRQDVEQQLVRNFAACFVMGNVGFIALRTRAILWELIPSCVPSSPAPGGLKCRFTNRKRI